MEDAGNPHGREDAPSQMKIDPSGSNPIFRSNDPPFENQDPAAVWEQSSNKLKLSWDHAYERELQSFYDSGDVGEIWFGEESMDRIITWLELQNIPKDAALLDIGTGNGYFLIELAKSGFTNLTGIDNSPPAVELAKAFAKKEEVMTLKLQVADILHPFPNLSQYEICIDKGTFDAISLSPDHPAEKLSLYRQALHSVLKDGGLFLITSCNWTKEELLSHFNKGFEMLQELPTPKFQFGGKTGNSVTALVFKRK
ncbi:EEF1A lysine methyltransferase 2 isoform X2 [Chiloscyllium plagiosum]|uniref:EEF1A lysine methyltransferase 2 isoform X2 n=1 Tax=Chiloscyllium plagiosum TaxID=36176 RepID=UPI001CB83F4C|nr:EEF1A lysine methyltransferase 2 isoform X2 [Chiloscyllium plagiosum]